MRNFLLGLAISILVIFSAIGGALADRLFVFRPLDVLLGAKPRLTSEVIQNSKTLDDDGMVVNVAEKVSPSVASGARLDFRIDAMRNGDFFLYFGE